MMSYSNNQESLLSLASKGEYDKIRTYFTENLLTYNSVFSTDNEKNNCLHYLIQTNEYDILKPLLVFCQNTHPWGDIYLFYTNRAGKSLWDLASQCAMQVLIELYSPIIFYKKESPLYRAIQRSLTDPSYQDMLIRLAQEKKINPESLYFVNSFQKIPPLAYAAQNKTFELLNALLSVLTENSIRKAQYGRLDTWLHAMTIKADEATIRKLFQGNNLLLLSLNSENKYGWTPLHVAAFNGKFEIYIYFASLGANSHIYNDGKSPHQSFFQALSRLDHPQRETIITKMNNAVINDKTSLDEANEYIALWRLYLVFGGEKLPTRLYKRYNAFIDGGDHEEILPFLKEKLYEFFDLLPDKFKRSTQTLQLFNNYFNCSDLITSKNECINKLWSNEPILTVTGYNGHVVGIVFEKQMNEIVLSLTERGLWLKKENNKTMVVRSMRFTATQDFLELAFAALDEANEADEKDKAHLTLFTDLPKVLSASFEDKNSIGEKILGHEFKGGICFYGNIIPIVHDSFIKAFGMREGRRLYKELIIFLCKDALKYYQEVVPDVHRDQDLIEICNDIIDKKKTKLQNETKPRLQSEIHVPENSCKKQKR